MMRMIITRYKEGLDSTIGKFMLLDSNNNIIQEGFTLEPSGPDTIKSNLDRRIPVGVYKTMLRFSPKYKLTTPILFNKDVPYDRYVLIHIGNFPDDTDGCILVGDGIGKNSIKNSRKTFSILYNHIKDDDFIVEIMQCIQ